MPRTKRVGLTDVALAAELDRLRAGRHALIAICKAYPYFSPAYQAAEQALRALDEVAERLTGKREVLQDPPAPQTRTPGPVAPEIGDVRPRRRGG